MTPHRKRLEELRARGLLDEATFQRLLESEQEGSQSGQGGAVAVAVARGPRSKAIARSTGGTVEAVAGPHETVIASSDEEE